MVLKFAMSPVSQFGKRILFTLFFLPFCCQYNVASGFNPSLTHYGKQFVLGFTAQPQFMSHRGYNEISILALLDTSVTISLHDSRKIVNARKIRAGRVLRVKISSIRMHSTTIDNKGLLLTATEDVAVYCLSQAVRSSDSYLALPTHVLGTKYVIASYTPESSVGESNLAIISPQDNTTVRITLNSNGKVQYKKRSFRKGQTFHIKLNKLQTFHLAHKADLSGTILEADKPVAVLSGDTCAKLYSRRCDYLVGFLLSVESWGRNFIVSTTGQLEKNTGDVFRVYAYQSDTQVRSKRGVSTLGKGLYMEYHLGDDLASFIHCSKPCQVVQYTKGYRNVQGRQVDPSMIVLPSINHFLNEYEMSLAGERRNLFKHSISIIIKTSKKDGIIMNGQNLAGQQWKHIEGTEYSWTVVQMTRSVKIAHNLRNVLFGLLVFGEGNFESYGHPAGFNFFSSSLDFNECLLFSPCHVNATCNKTMEAYSCTCNSGYVGDGFTCDDLNECLSYFPCHANATCSNTIGSFICSCDFGFSGNGLKCNDINECLSAIPCHKKATCSNTEGSFVCTCNAGYSGDGFACDEVNECLLDSPCHDRATCINNEGSYTCTCNSGYSGDGFTCDDINECLKQPLCHDNATCVNVDGSFDCKCDSGFSGDGFQCDDINECETQSPCHVNAVCNNTEGSYICSCNSGYYGNGITCDEQVSWSRWTPWSDCTVSCNTGKQVRKRHCGANLMVTDEKHCSGKSSERRDCSTWKCPDCNKICKTGKLNSDCDACICDDNILTGTVKSNTGALLNNATIALAEFPFKILARTKISGQFKLKGMCISEDKIIVSRNGYLSQTLKTTRINPSRATVTATLKLLVLPEVTTHPESKLRLEGQPMTLCCQSESKPKVKFEWMINGRDAEIYQHDGAGSSRLIIPQVYNNMSGTIKCRVYNDHGAEFSNPARIAIYNASDDTCNPTPSEKFVTLPQGCTNNEKDSRKVNVGTCHKKKCICRGLKNLNNCKDNFCCQPVSKTKIKITCLRDSFDLTRVTMCGCGECPASTTRSVVKGVATGGPDNIPFKYGYIYQGDKFLTRTGRKGHFSFTVDNELTRLVVNFKDKRGYNNFQDLTKVIPLVPGSTTYVEVRMTLQPKPVVFNSKDGFEIELGDLKPTKPSNSKNAAENSDSEDKPSSLLALTLPPQSLMTEDGEIYSGKAKVEVSFVDPRNSTQVEEADGDFSTVNEDGEQQLLETFGVIQVNFKDLNGKRLQPSAGIDVLFDPDEFNITDKEAENIKLWYMDEKTGRWRIMDAGIKKHKTRRSKRSGREFFFGNIDPTQYTKVNLDKLARICHLKIKVADEDTDEFQSAEVNVLAKQNDLNRYMKHWIKPNIAKCIETFCTQELAIIQASLNGKYLVPNEATVADAVKREHEIKYYRSTEAADRFSNRITIKKLSEPMVSPSPFYRDIDSCRASADEHSFIFEVLERKDTTTEVENFNDGWYPDVEASVCYVKLELKSFEHCSSKTAALKVESLIGVDQISAGYVVVDLSESQPKVCAEYKCPEGNSNKVVVSIVPYIKGRFEVKPEFKNAMKTTELEVVYFEPKVDFKDSSIGISHSIKVFIETDENKEKIKAECMTNRWTAGIVFHCVR